MNTPPSFRFAHDLRVRWAEVDMQKIVFNAHYLTYLDTAMADYWRALALPYEEAMQLLEGDLYVKKASLEYHASARYDDVLSVGLRCRLVGVSSIQFDGVIRRAGQQLAVAELVYVFADPQSQRAKPVPEALRAVLGAYEQGEAVYRVEIGSWAELAADAGRVREQVFVQEQNIPLEMEWDQVDETARHAVIYNRLGQAVATGRLVHVGQGVAKIGRMAVLRPLRRSGLGRVLVQQLISQALDAGMQEVVLSAQYSASRFYERLGFAARGNLFEEVGIPHIEMFCRI